MPSLIPNPSMLEGAPLSASWKVLLVDEDCVDSDYYCAILREQGCEVHVCVSYAEGGRRLAAEHFDLVVLCQGSRAFEGRGVLERAMEINRHLPVLVLARSLDMGCYLEAMQLGAVDYIEKPVAGSEIARVVKTHLRARRAAA